MHHVGQVIILSEVCGDFKSACQFAKVSFFLKIFTYVLQRNYNYFMQLKKLFNLLDKYPQLRFTFTSLTLLLKFRTRLEAYLSDTPIEAAYWGHEAPDEIPFSSFVLSCRKRNHLIITPPGPNKSHRSTNTNPSNGSVNEVKQPRKKKGKNVPNEDEVKQPTKKKGKDVPNEDEISEKLNSMELESDRWV